MSDYHTHDYADVYHQHDDKAEEDHRHLELARELDRLDQALRRATGRIDALSRRLVSVEDQAMTSRERLDMLNADYPPELTEEEQANPTF